MNYDVIVIGGGLSGLTAGSLLAKKGYKVALIDKNYNPGGSCGIFKRNQWVFDQGSAMLYGFGEAGFNAHRFVFNCLEEPIDMIKHDYLYAVNFKGERILFPQSVSEFVEELTRVFPHEEKAIKRFYDEMETMYRHVMVENPAYTSADETKPSQALKSMIRHPLSYARFLGYLNKSAKSLLQKYFKDPEIYKFFDKLTSTYCYATVEEAPAVLASVMFIDNHFGGSYYPAGSTLFLPGKLEKVIEEHNGDMYLESEVIEILFDNHKPIGVLLNDGTKLYANDIVYSGTVWRLYDTLLPKDETTQKERKWAESLVPTYPSVVFYTVVKKNVIPEDTLPIEMLVGNPDYLDESEVTAYLLSIDDRTLCQDDEHIVIAIGPTFAKWDKENKAHYQEQKEAEIKRLTDVLERRFPGFGETIKYSELATPISLERYLLKKDGAVAGPKQMLGQHLFKRLHIRSRWMNLYCCGESTVMGTGTPTVTTSGLSAANAILRKYKQEPFVYEPNRPNYVRFVEKPVHKDDLYQGYSEEDKSIMLASMRCRFCEHPLCTQYASTDVRGIMRRVAVGNFVGAKKCYAKAEASTRDLESFEDNCINNIQSGSPVEIKRIIEYIVNEK